MVDELKLKVAETIQEDVNKGIVRIDSSFMRKLDIRPGNIVQIVGERTTVGIADRALPGDIGLNIIRMDGIIRRNARTSIGEYVKIQRADIKEAKKIRIAPAREGVIINTSNPLIFKQGLLGRAVTKGDLVALGGTRRRRSTMSNSPFADVFSMLNEESLMGFGLGDLKFLVVDVQPKQAVLITESTEVEYSSTPVEMKEDTPLFEVSYEDIGGLGDEVKKIREMVELPLKHPEVFERLGIEPPKGVLLHGPPGTGKTLLAKAVANETNSNFLVINGPEIMCVKGDTKLFTNPKGHVKVQEVYDTAQGKTVMEGKINVIELDKPIKTFAYNNDKIEKAHITHVAKLKAPSFEVTFSDGNTLTCSQNQPFLIYENGQLIWKRLEELKTGTFIARMNKTALPEESQKIALKGFAKKDGKLAPKSRNLSRSNWIKLPETTSPDLLEYVGLILAEGYIAEDSITFANNDEDLRKRYKTLLKKLFDITKVTEYKDGRVVVYSKVLVELAKLFLMHPGKKDPKIAPMLYKMSKREVAAFIKGYFDGDGTVAINGGYATPKLYSASEEFLQEMQALLLLKLGIAAKLNKHKTKKGMMYALIPRGWQGRKDFARQIKPTSKEKAKRLQAVKTSGKEWANLPKPELLLSQLRTLPYQAYRNHDYYVYGKGRFTKHAMNNLYNIVQKNKKLTKEVKQEYNLLNRQDIAWERITSIKNVGVQELYDFTVDKDSFTAGPYLLLHNSKFYGESEQNLRKKFEEAEKNAPSIIFIDEIDAIASKREESKGEVERRVVAQLLTIMDGLKSRGKVVVIAATNIPNSIDPALRRPGRFDRELEIGVPQRDDRHNILRIHTRNMPLSKDVELEKIAEITHGFVGADLASLAKEAAMTVLRRILPDLNLKEDESIPPEVLEKLQITMNDFKEALKVVRPSALREVLIEIPNIKWEDVGGLNLVKQELKEAVEWPLKNADSFKRMGIKPPKGILLYGPPGTGKTLLAKAVAKESEANFILVKGPELISKWVGESEKAVREVFKKARQASPTIIFFDEIDSIAPSRGGQADGASFAERVVNQLLTEMDGLQELADIVIIAATNRPDILDTALLRPGRFDRIVLVSAPDEKAREEIFKVHTKNMPLHEDVSLKALVQRTQGYVGADIESVAREAGILALRSNMDSEKIRMSHFEEALEKVKPSVNADVEKAYEELQKTFRRASAEEMKENRPAYYG